MPSTSSSSPAIQKSTIAVQNDDEKIIIHRNGRGVFGHVKTWNRHGENSFLPSKLFAIFHLLRNPFLWHFWFPIAFLIVAIIFTVHSDYYYPIKEAASDSNQNGSPLWTSSGANAILIVFAFLSATVVLRIISPLFFSERGHRSDWRLPVDVIVNTSTSINSTTSTTLPSRNVTTELVVNNENQIPSSFSFNEHNHCPFKRVPLTPKAVGFFACILFHPISHFILLYTNAFVPEGFVAPVSSSSSDDGVLLHRESVLKYSPFSFVSSWFTFDFIKYTASMIEHNVEGACTVGRFWYWFVVCGILLVFYFVVLGILWNSVASPKIDREGHRFKYFGLWSLIWSVGLALFPIFFRVLFTGFGCFSTSRVYYHFYPLMNETESTFSLNTTSTIPVISICPSQRCDSDSQTATFVVSFIVLILTLPVFLNIHTQLRRLSAIPTLRHDQKVQPLPRVDGLHLYLLILIRFLIPAFSGVLGSMTPLCLAAFLLDCILAFVTWKSPSVSNVSVINFWYKKWTVPASLSSSLLFALWVALVWNHDAKDVEWNSGLETTVKMVSLCLQILAFFMLVFFFVTTYFEFKNEYRKKRGSANVVLTNLQAMLRYDLKSLLAGNRNASSSSSNTSQSPFFPEEFGGRRGAVGGAVESSVIKGPSRSSNDTGDESNAIQHRHFSPAATASAELNHENVSNEEASPTPRHDNDHDDENMNDAGRNEREEDDEDRQHVFLHDEAHDLSLFGGKNGFEYDDPLSDISSHVSFG